LAAPLQPLDLAVARLAQGREVAKVVGEVGMGGDGEDVVDVVHGLGAFVALKRIAA
jgi:hypothetical protein